MLRASILQKAGALAKHGLVVANRPTAAPALSLSRLATHCAAVSLTRTHRSYATTPKHIRKRKAAALEAERPPKYLHHIKLLHDALQANNISHIASAYKALRNQLPLGAKDFADIANALHTALRLLTPSVRQTRIPAELDNLAELLVLDLQANILPPSYHAHLHLLSFYKEAAAFEKGNAFWSWLVRQSDDYVNANLYGAALELFAHEGRPAEDTESLYQKALARFPGVFFDYHLSHNAVLADRSQPTAISAIPKALLQGILTARILRGDAKNAYLTLDTTLRLFPTKVPSRFITLFVQERPLNEAYKVFFLACRAGSTPGHDALKILLTRLRKLVAVSPTENAALLRAMVMACYAHTTSGAALSNKSLNELVIATTGSLKDHVYTKMSSDQLRLVTDALSALIVQLFGVWSAQGSPPGIASFNSIIANLAGRGKRRDILDQTLETMKHIGLQPNTVTLRSILAAAGDMNDAEAIRSAWTDLVANRIATGAALELVDWQNLLNACRRINDPGYIQEQLINFQHIVSPHILDRMSIALQTGNFSRLQKSNQDISLESTMATKGLLKAIELLKRDVEYMAENAQSNRNFRADPLSPSLTKHSGLYENVPEHQIRTVYDEMTTDIPTLDILPESSPKPEAEEQPPAMSPTGFPFDELRYENWKTINELLFDARSHDKMYMDGVDNAIKSGIPPPSRDTELGNVPKLDEFAGLSESAPRSVNDEQGTVADKEVTLDELRENIFELRGRKA